jgi:hypothetical protein
MTTLSPKLMLQVEASLRSDCECADTLRRLFDRGRQLGLTSAELDAALDGSSFEVRSAAAVALACALKSADAEDVASARLAGLRAGLTSAELVQIEAFAETQLEGSRS